MSDKPVTPKASNLLEFVEASTDNTSKLDSIADQTVTIEAVTFTDTGKAKHGIMTVKTAANVSMCVVNTSEYIGKALRKADAAKAFPVTATFTKKGQRWVLK